MSCVVKQNSIHLSPNLTYSLPHSISPLTSLTPCLTPFHPQSHLLPASLHFTPNLTHSLPDHSISPQTSLIPCLTSFQPLTSLTTCLTPFHLQPHSLLASLHFTASLTSSLPHSISLPTSLPPCLTPFHPLTSLTTCLTPFHLQPHFLPALLHFTANLAYSLPHSQLSVKYLRYA